jgi:hypothetical protein
VARKQATEPAPAASDEPAAELEATAGDEPAQASPEPEPTPVQEREPEPTPAQPQPRGGRRYRHRELKLADGGRLVLRTDGTIARFDDADTRTASWTTDDPEWPGYAIRFGLHPEPGTVAPNGSGVRGTRPPS